MRWARRATELSWVTRIMVRPYSDQSRPARRRTCGPELLPGGPERYCGGTRW
jgi:hypothetical protein